MSFRLRAYRDHLLCAMGLAPLALAGCATEADEPDLALGAELDASELGVDRLGPPGLTLTLPAVLTSGTYGSLRVSGATPGERVYIAYAQGQGAGACPPALGGVCLDVVGRATVFGSAIANAQGVASVRGAIDHAWPDGLVAFQAAQGGAQPAESAVRAPSVVQPARVCGGNFPFLDNQNYTFVSDSFACYPAPAGGGRCAPAAGFTSVESERLFTLNTGVAAAQPWGGYAPMVWCEETSVQDACCYHMTLAQIAIGRPFSVDGAHRVARASDDAGWCADVTVDADALPADARARVAEAWLRTARGEHASVAAFARFVLQLTAVGAPAALVADAAAALADEVRHARDAFSVASALAGVTLGAGPMDVSGALDGACTLEALVRDTVREGCIAESLSAAEAAVARDAASDPVVRELLAGVADDEARHAGLAWRFVRWALTRDPSLRAVVEQELARGPELPAVTPEPHAAAMRAFGQLPEADRAALGRRVFDAVVAPCAAALWAAEAPASSDAHA
jgi:hypothetical protein